MSPGEVRYVWFPFSYAESTPYKSRPVLVLRSFPGATPQERTLLVAMITSNAARVAAPQIGDIVIDNWQAVGLKWPSVIRTRRLWTAEPRDFTGTALGWIEPQLLAQVMTEIQKLVE